MLMWVVWCCGVLRVLICCFVLGCLIVAVEIFGGLWFKVCGFKLPVIHWFLLLVSALL